MERYPQLRKRGPLRHGLEVVQGLGCLDLHDAEQLPASLSGLEHEVGVPGRGRGSDRRRLLVARVDRDVELSLVLCLKQTDYTIVLELLAHRPHEDGAQQNLRRGYTHDLCERNVQYRKT